MAAPVAQQESTDLRVADDDRFEQRFRSRDDLLGGGQHESWPIARRARQRHPRASSLAAYFWRVDWLCCPHGLPSRPLSQAACDDEPEARPAHSRAARRSRQDASQHGLAFPLQQLGSFGSSGSGFLSSQQASLHEAPESVLATSTASPSQHASSHVAPSLALVVFEGPPPAQHPSPQASSVLASVIASGCSSSSAQQESAQAVAAVAGTGLGDSQHPLAQESSETLLSPASQHPSPSVEGSPLVLLGPAFWGCCWGGGGVVVASGGAQHPDPQAIMERSFFN